MKKTCRTCRYYSPNTGADSGQCRISPPHPKYAWPLVNVGAWCGQRQPEASSVHGASLIGARVTRRPWTVARKVEGKPYDQWNEWVGEVVTNPNGTILVNWENGETSLWDDAKSAYHDLIVVVKA